MYFNENNNQWRATLKMKYEWNKNDAVHSLCSSTVSRVSNLIFVRWLVWGLVVVEKKGEQHKCSEAA